MPHHYSEIERAMIEGATFYPYDPEDGGRVLFRWYVGPAEDPEIECSMAFDTMVEAARDALQEIKFEREAES